MFVFLLIRHVSLLVIILVLFIHYTSTNSASTRPRTDQTPLAGRLTGLRLWSRADSHRPTAAVLWRAHHRTGLVQCRADRLHPEGDGLQGQDDPVHHPPAEQQSLLHVRPAHVPLRGTPGLHGLHRQCSQVLLQVSRDGDVLRCSSRVGDGVWWCRHLWISMTLCSWAYNFWWA